MEDASKIYTIGRAASQRLYGLRGVAILLVLWDHYNLHALPLHLGPVGVRLFFVLSGFHITLSFWRAQEKAGLQGSWLHILKNFYLKRFLRIAPLFYGGLLLGLWAGLPQARETIRWDSLFLTNFYVVHANEWPGATAHFWSLAMQEQFYLLWPLLLLVACRWSFRATVGLTVVCTLFFRFYCDSHGLSPYCKWLLLPGCWDSFMAGAVLAHVYADPAKRAAVAAAARKVARPALWLTLPFAAGITLHFLPEMVHLQFLRESLEAVSLAALVWATFDAHGRFPHLDLLVENRHLIHIGKISYALYIFQFFFFCWLGPKLAHHLHDPFAQGLTSHTFLLLTFLSVLCLSYGYEAWGRMQKRRLIPATA